MQYVTLIHGENEKTNTDKSQMKILHGRELSLWMEALGLVYVISCYL